MGAFSRISTVVLSGCLGTGVLLADFSYNQTTKFTGGAMVGMMKFMSRQMREPQVSTVLIKGDRMASVFSNRTQVIDIAAETITSIDHEKKTYSVVTFAEMKQMLDEMQEKMKKQTGGQEMKFSVSVKETGQTKDIAGFKAKEMQLTIKMEGQDAKSGEKGAMNILNDMWVAPDVPGYKEVREFHQRMAAKLAWSPGSNFLSAMQPGASQGMAEAAKEMSKLDGVPVLVIMRMGGAGQSFPQPGEAGQQAQEQQQAGPSASESAGNAIANKLPGLGRFGGFGRKKKQEAEQQPQQQQQAPPPAASSSQSGSLMEITTEASGFSSASVDGSKFEVPAGFKKVEDDMMKRRR